MDEKTLINLLNNGSPELHLAFAKAINKARHEQLKGTKIFLTRHQISEGNIDTAKYSEHGDHDTPASQQNKDQSINLGTGMINTVFPSLNISECPRIWISPHKRAHQTAATALDTIRNIDPNFINETEYKYENDFMGERYFGLLPHREKIINEILETEEEKDLFQKFLRAIYVAYKKDSYSASPPNGESRRFMSLAAKLSTDAMFRDMYEGKTTHWVFSHGDEIKARLLDFMHLDGHDNWDKFKINNCDTYMISNDAGYWKIQQVYDGKSMKPCDGAIIKRRPETLKETIQKYSML